MSLQTQRQYTRSDDGRSYFLLGKSPKLETWTCVLHPSATRNVCDFVVWTSNVCIVVEVALDAEFVAGMVPKLWTFFRQCVLPELLTHRMQHGHEPTCSVSAVAHASTDA